MLLVLPEESCYTLACIAATYIVGLEPTLQQSINNVLCKNEHHQPAVCDIFHASQMNSRGKKFFNHYRGVWIPGTVVVWVWDILWFLRCTELTTIRANACTNMLSSVHAHYVRKLELWRLSVLQTTVTGDRSRNGNGNGKRPVWEIETMEMVETTAETGCRPQKLCKPLEMLRCILCLMLFIVSSKCIISTQQPWAK